MSNHLVITLLISTIALATVNAILPSYIIPCKRHDPNVTTCIENSVLSLKPQLAAGIPELGVPPLDPMTLPLLNLDLGTGFHAIARNIKVSGGKNFEIQEFSADINADVFSMKIRIPKLSAVGEYEIDAKIGAIPLKGKGTMNLKLKTLDGIAKLYGQKVPRGGKTSYYFKKMDLKAELEDYEIVLDNLFADDPAIGKATNKLLNDEKTEVKNTLIPALEKSLSELILRSANNICKHFTWEELFPV